MKLGVFTVLFGGQPFDKALDYIKKSGLEAVEIGVGSWPGSAHCPVDELLASKDKTAEYKRKITGRGLEISALSEDGSPSQIASSGTVGSVCPERDKETLCRIVLNLVRAVRKARKRVLKCARRKVKVVALAGTCGASLLALANWCGPTPQYILFGAAVIAYAAGAYSLVAGAIDFWHGRQLKWLALMLLRTTRAMRRPRPFNGINMAT
jgi:hypothetical protein